MKTRSWKRLRTALGLSLSLIIMGAACAQEAGPGGKNGELRVAVVCDSAGQNDNGYNQSAAQGAKEAAEKLGCEYKIFEPSNGVPATLESLAEEGYSLIFSLEYDFDALIHGVGGSQALAERYPDTTFVIFNDNPNRDAAGKILHKNVISVLFDVHEASFEAGALSVLVNEQGSILFPNHKLTNPNAGGRGLGFIGGTNSNGITVFANGFIQGANYMAEQLGVEYDFYAKYDAGFSDSAAGSSIAGTYYQKGANIVFACAGAVGEGVCSKAKELGRLAIQVDANKDASQEGYVLTSVLKNTRVPVLAICEAASKGELNAMDRVQNYSLDTGATGITDLKTIEKQITSSEGQAAWKKIKEQLNQLHQKIGKEIKVVNSQAGEVFDPASCPRIHIR